jgi:phosphopantetheinyl transferase
MLAALYCADVPLNLNYLFIRRRPKFLSIFAGEESAQPHPDGGALQSLDAAAFADGLCDGDPAVSRIIGNYLHSLATFHGQMMQVNADVMAAYLHTPQGEPIEPDCYAPISTVSPPMSVSNLPFVSRGIITSQSAEGALELSLNLTLNEHRYLLDHAIGGAVLSSGERVYLVPLTVALEIMAETASLLMPGLSISALQNVRASKRLRVSTFGCPIRVTATIDLKRSNIIVAEILSADENADSEATPMMACEVVFAHQLAGPPAVSPVPADKPSKLPHLYGEGAMFHGETMQSIERIDSVGERCISVTGQVRPATGWFATDPNPRFLCDPLLLDNATQAVLFYLYENNAELSALLPFFIDSIEFFADLVSWQNTRSRIEVALRAVTATGTESDITIFSEPGDVLVKFNRLSHRSIAMNEQWQQLIASPADTFLSQELPSIAAVLPRPSHWSAAKMEESLLPTDEASLMWVADYLLSEDEHRFCLRLPNAHRRREWLIGRIAAKDSIRRLALQLNGLIVQPADVEIEQAGDGKPIVSARAARRLGWMPVISISHKDGKSVALAGHPSAASAVGIDIESATEREEGFERLAYADAEKDALQSLSGDARVKLSAQLWCAKEAVGKALGSGLSNNPRSIVVTPAPGGSPHKMIARQASNYQDAFVVHFLPDTEPTHVLAVTVLEPA